MKAVLLRSCLVVCGLVCMVSSSSAQPPVGALAIDERQGARYGWAVDYSTASAARSAALGECGPGCSVVLTFERCAAYAADQDANSTAVGWAESDGSVEAASGAALSACGSGCIVRVWGCNGPVVEEGLGLDRSARREIQEGLRPRASTRALRTGGSAPGRGRRLVAGSRIEECVRRAIWTARRRRRCARQTPRRRRSGNGLLASRFPRGSSRPRRVSGPLRPRPRLPPRSSRVCSGSR